VIPLLSAPTFDPSLIEILLPLHTGNTLHIFTNSHILYSPTLLFEAIMSSRVTHLFLTPSLFCSLSLHQQSFILSGHTFVSHVILGGEKFPTFILKYLVDALECKKDDKVIDVWNIYGTTECSVWATLFKVFPASIESLREMIVRGVPIGDPLDCTLLEVRRQSSEMTIDNGGELYLGGPDRVCVVGDETKGLVWVLFCMCYTY
jgi:acyl-CoA synthetase